MEDKIIVGPINRGQRNDRTAFVIDNDSFPFLINAYQWRGRIKRKRGTANLVRLTRFFNSNSSSYGSISTITLNGAGTGNILSGFNLETTSSIVIGSVSITDTITLVTYTDPSKNGTLSPSGSINYATGSITIAAAANHAIRVQFLYYPALPVLGLEDLSLSSNQFPGTLGFDTTYSYNITTASPYTCYDVSFYKNPGSGTYTSYVAKSNVTQTWWNGQTYQQFWTANYSGALWATNGITIPFNIAHIGMQYKFISGIAIITPTQVNLTITAHGLVVGDFLFINEVQGTTGINLQTGYVITVIDANTVAVKFPNATIANAYTTGGIAQYLTNRADTTIDCIRWYDGDPTNGSATSPVLNGTLGWVNFCPPLSNSNYSIADLPAAQYYLVGARMIVPFKDRLIFFGAVIQTSAPGSQVYLPDTIIYSQNGTPYYTCSFTGDPTLAKTVFNPILVPINQTATANAYFEDVTGFGGFLTVGISQAITTVNINEDVLIVGFEKVQTRMVYTGNDLLPFNFFIINSEFGSGSTFSAVTMDQGVFSRGSRGYIITSQTSSQRIDLEIPDSVFQIGLTNNGTERFCAQRDFINEWIYFTYPVDSAPDSSIYIYPTETLQYNYRDNSWATFYESYTTYGSFRTSSGYTWATIGTRYPTWSSWNDPWDAGVSNLLQQQVIAGNQQGFVIFRGIGTNEANSLYIKGLTIDTVTCPDHSLNEGDYFVISGVLGTIGSSTNGVICKVTTVIDANSFKYLRTLTSGGTYLGGGVIQRMYVPFIQTKQFPTAWGLGRKTRIGVQQYLFTTTKAGQVQLQIYLSQNANSPYNTGAIVPSGGPTNSSLIYSTTLYTCPESTNLGLTPANINLQIPTATNQEQTWHRINTSLIGDTVQIAFTLSDDLMTDTTFSSQFTEIELHGFILNVYPSQILV